MYSTPPMDCVHIFSHQQNQNKLNHLPQSKCRLHSNSTRNQTLIDKNAAIPLAMLLTERKRGQKKLKPKLYHSPFLHINRQCLEAVYSTTDKEDLSVSPFTFTWCVVKKHRIMCWLSLFPFTLWWLAFLVVLDGLTIHALQI